jgi:hypothetical protein
MRRKRKIIHNKQVKRKLSGLVLLVCWVLIGGLVWFVDPEIIKNIGIKNAYLPMGILLWLGVFLFLRRFLNRVRALVWASGTLIFLYFRLWGMESVINGLLLLGILVSIELYLRQRKNLE